MLKFLSKSFIYVSIFSAIRFLINLYFASFLFPSDYAIILIPLIIFSFLDIYVEGGFYMGIVKKGITQEQERKINISQFKKVVLWGIGIITILFVYSQVNINQNIPFAVIFCFYLCSVFRVLIYTKEAVLVASGRYIKSEVLNFFSTCFVYLLAFMTVLFTDISGFYALCLFHLGFVFVYGLSLQIFGREHKTPANSDISDLFHFSRTNRNSSILFTLSGRVDELSTSFFFLPDSLGIFSKTKEISIMLGTFSSRVISRPWYYIACNMVEKRALLYHIFSIASMFLLMVVLFPFLKFLSNIIIGIMGKNWEILFDFSSVIIIISCAYLLTEFTRCSLIATGGENFVLKLEKLSFFFRISIYSLLLLLSGLNSFEFKVYDILLLEIFIRISYLLIQTIYFFFKFIKNNKNDWETDT